MRPPTTQHERGKSSAHADKVCILLALRIDPRVERIEDPCPCTPDFHCLRYIPESIEKSAHRSLCRHASSFGAADTISNRRGDIPTFFGNLQTKHRADKILIARPRTNGRVMTDANARRCQLVVQGGN